jgi:two-component system, LytTR family, response regulator AlgR
VTGGLVDERRMNVLVVDDEALARERLARMIAQLGSHAVVGQAANGREALALAEQTHPDVVLLDIRMPGMDGLEAARHLAALPEPPAVVFCTAYEEHAIAAFDVQAVGYLLKPVRRERLAAVLEKAARVNRVQLAALGRLGAAQRTHISARTHRGLELIPVDEILCFRADHKYVVVRHTGGEVLVEDTLRELEEEFGERFVRVHRATLAAVRHIERLERGADGHALLRLRQLAEPLEVSRRHLPDLRRRLLG